MSPTIPQNAVTLIPNAAHLVKAWLPASDADAFGVAVVEETFPRWTNQLSYGKGRPYFDSGHQMARFGDSGVTYTYKDKPKPMYPMTASLDALRKIVSGGLAWEPNCVVVNSYAPASGLYPHRDGHYIPQLGSAPTIVAVSFGVTRTFRLHPVDHVTGKRQKQGVIDVPLGHGDLLVMHGRCDLDFQHSIPEEPHVTGTRVSLTFRRHLA